MAGYGDDAAFAAYAEANGYEIPLGTTAAVLRQKGSAYVDGTYESEFVGYRAGGFAQDRAWPRANAVLRTGETVPDDVIPQAIINASYEAAIHEALNPGSLFVAASNAQRVVRERVEGAVDVSYASPGADAAKDARLVLTAVDGALWPFLRQGDLPAILVV